MGTLLLLRYVMASVDVNSEMPFSLPWFYPSCIALLPAVIPMLVNGNPDGTLTRMGKSWSCGSQHLVLAGDIDHKLNEMDHIACVFVSAATQPSALSFTKKLSVLVVTASTICSPKLSPQDDSFSRPFSHLSFSPVGNADSF